MPEDYSDYPEDEDGIKYDPIEKSQKYRKVIKEVEKEAEKIIEERFPGLKNQLGYCYSFWDEKKRILKEKHGIDWKTPAELNLSTLFD